MANFVVIPFAVQEPNHGWMRDWALYRNTTKEEAVKSFIDVHVKMGSGGVWGDMAGDSGSNPESLGDDMWSVYLPPESEEDEDTETVDLEIRRDLVKTFSDEDEARDYGWDFAKKGDPAADEDMDSDYYA